MSQRCNVVIESTVSPGTIDKYIRPIIEANGFVVGKDINLVHAPERIIPGNMVYELLHNNRTIGADNREIGEKIKDIYASFCQGEIVVTDIRTAEMTKVVENTFRAVNIALQMSLRRFASHDNMDVYEIIKNLQYASPCKHSSPCPASAVTVFPLIRGFSWATIRAWLK